MKRMNVLLLPLLILYLSNFPFGYCNQLAGSSDYLPIVPVSLKPSRSCSDSLDSMFAEQAAFDYFLSIVTKKRKDLSHQKYMFDGILNETYSEFSSGFICFNSELELYKKIKLSADIANRSKQEGSHKRLSIGNAQRKYFAKKNNIRALKMEVFKATKVDGLWYVQLRIEATEYQEDYFFEIDSEMNVKRWRPVVAVL